MCLSEFSDTMKALIKLYANQYGLAFFSFHFFLKKLLLGFSCETDATMRTFSNAVIKKKIKDLKKDN